jgi:hypothetical protein
MAPKRKVVEEASTQGPAKRIRGKSGAEAQVDTPVQPAPEAKAEVSKRHEQSNFMTQLALAAKKGDTTKLKLLEHIRALPRFSEKKAELLELWKRDKSCKWANAILEISSSKTVVETGHSIGYGTKCQPQLDIFITVSSNIFVMPVCIGVCFRSKCILLSHNILVL